MYHEKVVTSMKVLPAGMRRDDPSVMVYFYQVDIVYQDGKYSVQNQHRELSRQGRWASFVPRKDRFNYRFDSLERAIVAAESVVDSIKVMDLTWKQLEEALLASV